MLAAVQAAGLVHPHLLEAQFLRPHLHVVAHFFRALGGATAALVAVRPPVAADEHMRLVNTAADRPPSVAHSRLSLAAGRPYLIGTALTRSPMAEPAEPAGPRDLALSAPARRQSGALAALGRRGAGRGATPPTSRSCSRSATPPATGAMSWRTNPSKTPTPPR